jgi:hypothetical protein
MTLYKLAKQLDDARRDVAELARLTDAEKRVEELSAAYGAAKVIADYEAAEKAAAGHQRLMDGISDIRIAAPPIDDTDENLLRRRFKIGYTALAYNFRTGHAAPQDYTVEGFNALPTPVMLYLLEKRPDQIPAVIMALAPGDPRQAFNRYNVGQRRGHL